jgi:hypothetical protein
MEVFMLEDYYVKPSTVDRVRASWLAPQIESYLEWLEAHHYSRLVVYRRAGMTLHKGLSITSFPSDRKTAVDTLVAALGNAGVVKFVPIYDHRDSKIGIVVNRSAETPEEAKQY